MAYIVIAIGVLMSMFGIGAVAFGYPIIQVERGWATVIAGSTLLASGVIMVALGFVLQSLNGIRSALSTGWERPHSVPAGDDTALEGASERAIPSVADTMIDGPSLTPGTTRPAAPTFEPMPVSMVPAPQEDPVHVEPVLDVEPIAHAEASVLETHSDTHPPTLPVPEHDGYELQSPSTPDHDLAPPTSTPVAADRLPAEDDWLDRAFFDLDRDLSVGGIDKHVQIEPVATVEHHEQALVAHASAPEPYVESSPEEPVVTQSAVIGRYESEGTSYVMYADGSIEAQSEAGIYRFASMAELKSFIEG